MSFNKIHWKLFLVAITALAVGIFIGTRFFNQASTQAIYRKPGVLTNSLIGFEVNTSGEFDELKPIENAIREFVAERQSESQVEIISVYFRLLNSGRWFSINPEELYSPASLLKLPVMMAYFKQAEENPEILQKTIYNDGRYADTEQSTIPSERRLEKGTFYTVDDLIGRMIRDSNNEAKEILSYNLPSESISKIYEELKIKSPYTETGDFMNIAEYPFFLRVLYNTTYLNQKYSERALELLTDSSFTEGLPAKLPSGINVAHKFGFRIVRESSSETGELHDCGIVYYPEHPYTICIMTKGYALEPLTTVIQDLSLLTFKGVEDFFRSEAK